VGSGVGRGGPARWPEGPNWFFFFFLEGTIKQMKTMKTKTIKKLAFIQENHLEFLAVRAIVFQFILSTEKLCSLKSIKREEKIIKVKTIYTQKSSSENVTVILTVRSLSESSITRPSSS